MYLSLIKERKMGVKGTWEDSSALRIECPSILGEKTKKREREGEKGRQMMMESGLDLFKWPHMYARGKQLQLLEGLPIHCGTRQSWTWGRSQPFIFSFFSTFSTDGLHPNTRLSPFYYSHYYSHCYHLHVLAFTLLTHNSHVNNKIIISLVWLIAFIVLGVVTIIIIYKSRRRWELHHKRGSWTIHGLFVWWLWR